MLMPTVRGIELQKLVLGLSCCLLFLSSGWAQGSVKESSLESRLLRRSVSFTVYLPDGYERHEMAFPVLYLLHGYTDDHTGWTQFGEAHLAADRLMGQGEVPPMLIVTPDAAVSWYVNDDEGVEPYEDFFIRELIPHIEKNYRVRSKKEFRAVAGLSMGGHGSLLYALKYPDLFAACVPLSAAVITDEEIIATDQARWDTVFGLPFTKAAVGADRLNNHYRANAPIDLIKSGDAKQLGSVRFYIDCGDDDFLIKGNMQLHATMIDAGIPHEFRVRDGGHTWTYWRTALPEVFRFVGQSFRR